MTPERRAEIETALAAVTPGPWKADGDDRVIGAAPRDVVVADAWRGPRNWQGQANARLIANAPTYLRELLDALADAWDEGRESGLLEDFAITIPLPRNPYRSQP